MAVPALNVQSLGTESTFRSLAYHALKQAITEMDIYDHDREIRLDERQLSGKLGVSRADPRGVGPAGAGRLHPPATAPRYLRRAQDQDRDRPVEMVVSPNHGCYAIYDKI
ncbi:hypothetical protein [Azospirillum palustre]|uniref:hypothetical protein n=1 Tax=Azospirillum palustre TaxID=2044885 RepID=UPI00313AA328